MRWIVGIAAATLFAAPALAEPVPAGDTIALAPAVWVDYEIYLHNLGTGPAYYAVTKDGLGGAPSGCSLNKCLPTGAVPGKTGATVAEALRRCQEVSPPSRTCIIFAEGKKIVVPYEMRAY